MLVSFLANFLSRVRWKGLTFLGSYLSSVMYLPILKNYLDVEDAADGVAKHCCGEGERHVGRQSLNGPICHQG